MLGSMTFTPGAVVAGRFEILRPLGAGGLAQGFVARDQQTGEEVALKALPEVATVLHDGQEPSPAPRVKTG